eukprot:scaffold171_cov92-Cylindrotheca_fusiformis.AAC.2
MKEKDTVIMDVRSAYESAVGSSWNPRCETVLGFQIDFHQWSQNKERETERKENGFFQSGSTSPRQQKN